MPYLHLPQPLLSRGLVALSFALSFSLLAAPAFAQNAQSRLESSLEEAKDDYDMLMFDEAEETLQSAIRLAEGEGIRNNTLAQLFIMLGIVRHASGKAGRAEDAFVSALETYPDVELDPLYRTPALADLMERARQRARPPQPEPEPEPAVALPDDLEDMVHEPIRRARGGESLHVQAQVPEDLPVFRVYLHFRRFGEDEFQREEMLPTDAINFSVTLDSHQIYSSQLEYYISGVNRAGDSIAEAGRRTNPFRITLLGDTSRADAPRRAEGPDSTPDDPDQPRPPREGDSSTGFYGFAALGSDVGFLFGNTAPTANAHRTVTPGLAPAFAHAFIDLGWRLSELNNIGLYFRWQFSPPQDFSSLPDDRFDGNAPFWQHEEECFGLGLPGDCLLGLRYQRVVSTGFPQFYSSVGFGVGRIRNWLRLKEATSDANPNPICTGRDIFTDPGVGNYCYIRDTVRTGWAHIGVGGGVYFPVHELFDIVADSYLMVVIPDTSINLDLNVGLRFRL